MKPANAYHQRRQLARKILDESDWNQHTSRDWRLHTAEKEADRLIPEIVTLGAALEDVRVGRNGSAQVLSPLTPTERQEKQTGEKQTRTTLPESMRVTVLRPPRTRLERAGHWINYSGAAKLLSVPVVIAFTVSIAWAENSSIGWVHGLLLWSLAVLAVAFLLSVKMVIGMSESRREVIVGGQTGQSLRSCVNAWQSLPADIQEATWDVLDAAFRAAVLPKRAQDAVERRLVLLREFADEVRSQEQDRQVQAIGDDDLEMGQARLDGLKEARQITGRAGGAA